MIYVLFAACFTMFLITSTLQIVSIRSMRRTETALRSLYEPILARLDKLEAQVAKLQAGGGGN